MDFLWQWIRYLWEPPQVLVSSRGISAISVPNPADFLQISQDFRHPHSRADPLLLNSWAPKLNVLCPCTTDDLCQLVSKFVQSFSKYSVHNFSNRRTNGRMKGHAVRILYTILRTWSSGGITKHVNLVIYIIKPSFSNVLLVERNAKNKYVKNGLYRKTVGHYTQLFPP